MSLTRAALEKRTVTLVTLAVVIVADVYRGYIDPPRVKTRIDGEPGLASRSNSASRVSMALRKRCRFRKPRAARLSPWMTVLIPTDGDLCEPVVRRSTLSPWPLH